MAKRERILFHYNGHGVPKPTNNGELWMFNKSYTQYIPLSIYELQTWMGTPSIYVFDCSGAGFAVHWFMHFLEQRKRDAATGSRTSSGGSSDSLNSDSESNDFDSSILLAACQANETLPTNPKFPADLFASCLTTPIKTALRWFCTSTPLFSEIPLELIDQIPGKLNDRRTPMGELNWIFTAITDTIAWNVLPPALFKTLFRQDLLEIG